MRIRIRFALALALLLQVFAAHADDLQFVNGGGPYSASVGSDFVAQDAVLTFSSSSNTSSASPVQLEILGGCGTFAGGATKVPVSMHYSAPWWQGALPAVHLSQPGFCTLRLTFAALSRDAKLDVWDPATLHPEPVYPVVAVPLGDYVPADAAVRVVDAGGRRAYGELVKFGYSDCMPHGGVDRTTGTDGVASALNASGPVKLGHCPYPAKLSRNGRETTLDLLVFDRAKAHLGVADSLQSYVDEPFAVPLRFEDENGEALPRMPADLFAVGVSTGANAVEFTHSPSTALSGDDGSVVVAARANAQPGYYDILVVALGRELRVPVVQARRGQGAPALPARPSRSLQDLWWVGPSQNGWGMSIVQHGDMLFTLIYMYEGGGFERAIPPAWIVMPGGQWNATGTTYYGPIYRPSGASYGNYTASAFNVGPSWGSLSITYVDDANVEIFEREGTMVRTRRLTRQLFASGSSTVNVGDMWWGGASQNGWGIAVLQQGPALFCVWFTYDSGGRTWFVMPSGNWTSSDTWQGRLYRTSGSAGWGWDWYAPSYFAALDVGSFKLQFNGDSATFTYDTGTHAGVLPLQRQPF